MLFSFANAQPHKKKMKKYNAMPEWVMAKPQGGDYYIGISSAVKQGKTPDAYMAAARQNALADLAAAISTKIETSSTLYTLETTQQFGYNFSDDIRATSTVDLEGYELMGTWEDDENYWIYYRLSRSTYATRRAEKKRTAIAAAREKMLEGDRMLAAGIAYNAFTLYCNGLALLKPYLGESTTCSLPDGTETDLGNKLYAKLTDFVNNAVFVTPENGIIVKRGAEIEKGTMTFKLTDKNNKALSNVPIYIELTANGLTNPNVRTGQDGQFTCPVKKIKSLEKSEKIYLKIDVPALMRSTSDNMVRAIVKSIVAPRTEVKIEFDNPTLLIKSNDKKIETVAKDNFSSIFKINQQNPDFELTIEKEITFQEHGGTLFANVVANFVTTNSKKEILFRKRFQKEISGTDRKEMQAKGIDEICKAIERSIKQEITRNIF